MSSIAGTPAEFRSVHVTLRAPRVAIEVAGGTGWESCRLGASRRRKGLGRGRPSLSSEAPRESPCRRAALGPSTPIMCVALSTRLAKWKPFTKAGWWQFGEQVQQNLPDDWPNTTVSREAVFSRPWSGEPLSSHGADAISCCSAFPQTLQSLPAASLFKAANPKGVVLAAPAGLGGPLGLSLAMLW